jgi:hypothetical protein
MLKEPTSRNENGEAAARFPVFVTECDYARTVCPLTAGAAVGSLCRMDFSSQATNSAVALKTEL